MAMGLDRENKNQAKKLTKVISTKLSIEDFNRFERYTNYAYQAGKFIVTCPFNELGL
jgi:hypothetical protein